MSLCHCRLLNNCMHKEAMLYEKLADTCVQCRLCAQRCKISPSKFGFCGVRQNVDGVLVTLVYGEVIASHIDPIEKKPLYNFIPGSSSYSIATVGCNFKCGFCQNWQISQVSPKDIESVNQRLTPEDIVRFAKTKGCKSISYTYTEPTIFFEYAYDTAKLAKKEGLYNCFVTNGYMTEEALGTISPYLDAANVDLKSFREEFYTKICRGHLQPVLDTIKRMRKLNIWVEVTTLIVPDQNDSQEELKDIAKFIVSVDKSIPWHISRFHPNYKFGDYCSTSSETLKEAYTLGKEAGLRYIYLGNVADEVDTYCYNCGQSVISRKYFSIDENNIDNGKCKFCDAEIDGVFE